MVPASGTITIVQASGIESFTGKLQGGPISGTITQLQVTSGTNSTKVLQSNAVAFDSINVIEHGGVNASGVILTPDFDQTTNVPILQGPGSGTGFELSSSAFLQGVVGTSGSVEKFFDTSPFYFTEHETDPNTERDLREIEPFLVFSSATISTYSVTRRIPQSTQIIVPTVSAAGDDFFTNKASTFAFINTKPPSLDQVIGANGIILGPGATVTGTTTTLTGPISISGSVDIDQQDATAPFFDETQPASGTSFNDPEDLEVEFHIKDGGVGLDTGAMDVWIDDIQVVSASTTVTGVTWPTSFRNVLGPNDYEFKFTRGFPFDQQAIVIVSGELGDTGGNTIITQYDFTMLASGSLGATISGAVDADPPVIVPTNPVDLQTQVSPDTSLLWTLTDAAAGVDSAATRLYINGVIRLENDTAINGSFSRTGTSQDGFVYTFNPAEQFEFASTVTGTIQATDLATIPNTDSLEYEFTIAPTESLQITNFFLIDGESTLLTSGTIIEVDVIDTVHGVDVPETFLTINGTSPSGLTTAVITSGIRFSVPAQPLIDFREDLEVFVHAENLFPGAFPQIEEETFRLFPGYDVNWSNKLLGDSEVIFPYLSRIPVLVDIKNFSNKFADSTEYFFFLTENQVFADIGATLISNIKVAEMPATLTVLNPFYEYGKTIVLEIEVDDFDGNQLRFTHTYSIEPRP